MDEISHLRDLLVACHRALDELGSTTNDELAEAIRETCRLVEKRLTELTAT